jgi:hypothetical protein
MLCVKIGSRRTFRNSKSALVLFIFREQGWYLPVVMYLYTHIPSGVRVHTHAANRISGPMRLFVAFQLGSGGVPQTGSKSVQSDRSHLSKLRCWYTIAERPFIVATWRYSDRIKKVMFKIQCPVRTGAKKQR